MTENAQGLVDIGKLVLTFAKVNRVSYHEDGIRPESDTDHTVMLSVCACALAQKLYPELDRGMIAQYAIVHDLVEAYALDTDTYGMSEEKRKEKDAREHEAFLRIQNEFEGTFPWLSETIESYEKLDTKEARFVKTVDKFMPKITHILNDGFVFKEKRRSTEEEMKDNFVKERARLEEDYGHDFPEMQTLFNELNDEVLLVVHGKNE